MPRKKERVTLKDIAAKAGVSVMAVSYALRNHPNASPETCAKVQAIAQKLGYRPDPQLARLMTYLRGDKGSGQEVVAMLNPWAEKDGLERRIHARELLAGASARAEQFGFKVEVFWLRAPGMTEKRLQDILVARGIEGLLIPPLPQAEEGLHLDWSRFSVVSMHHVEWQPGMNRVCVDHFQGMRLALEKLHERGLQRIGFVQTRDLEKKVYDCWSAALYWYQQQIPAARRVPPFLVDRLEREPFLRWFRKERPDAIVSVYFEPTGWIAEGAGRRVSEDVLFVNLFADPSNALHPGINQNSRQVGAAAMDLLSGLLRRNEKGLFEHPKLMTLPATWVEAGAARAGGRKSEV